jgi:hypothetical protein
LEETLNFDAELPDCKFDKRGLSSSTFRLFHTEVAGLRIKECSSPLLRAKFGKEWSFPASIHANGNDDGGPLLVASSNIIVMASIYMTISGACAGATFFI